MIGCKRVCWINSCSGETRAPSVLEFYFLVPSKKGQSRQTPAGLAINRATLERRLFAFLFHIFAAPFPLQLSALHCLNIINSYIILSLEFD